MLETKKTHDRCKSDGKEGEHSRSYPYITVDACWQGNRDGEQFQVRRALKREKEKVLSTHENEVGTNALISTTAAHASWPSLWVSKQCQEYSKEDARMELVRMRWVYAPTQLSYNYCWCCMTGKSREQAMLRIPKRRKSMYSNTRMGWALT